MPPRISTNYAANNKADLLIEVEARKNEHSPNFDGINQDSLKDDIVAALNLDDEHKATEATAASTAGLPEVDEPLPIGELVEELPPASAYKGRYRQKKDQRVYALAVVDDFLRGRTHKARNTRYFWEGTKAEFEAQFVKE